MELIHLALVHWLGAASPELSRSDDCKRLRTRARRAASIVASRAVGMRAAVRDARHKALQYIGSERANIEYRIKNTGKSEFCLEALMIEIDGKRLAFLILDCVRVPPDIECSSDVWR